MSATKSLTIIALCLVLLACGDSKSGESSLKITTTAKDNVISLGENISFSIQNPKHLEIKSVTYKLNGQNIQNNTKLKTQKLGVQNLTAVVDLGDATAELSTKITILNNQLPKIYGYRIINAYPHDITSYTQGLEFYNGELFESTGQYGESKLRKLDYKTGEILKNVNLASSYFAEGLTILNDRIYQLTWQENIGFVYDVETFEKTGSFKYGQSKEGWGICNNGTDLFKSDGTENIWLLNPETLTEDSKIQVYTNKGKIVGINEMEWVEGKIYANRYQKNGVAIINPENGAVEGVIDFSPLRSKVTQHQGLDVLNGIAFNPETQTLFVTGKRWDKLFEVEVFEK